MAKLAIFLCLLIAAACVPSSQAGIFNSWGDQIHQAQEKVAKIVGDAIENFQKQVEDIKQRALDIATEIKKQGTEIVETLKSKLDEILKGVDEKIANITGDAEGVDVTECTDMAKEIKNTAFTLLANASYCVVDKIDQASGYVEGINHASQDALSELVQLNQKGTECTSNIDGIQSSVKALACLGGVAKDATVAVTKKIPEVVVNITKMVYLVNTLVPSLSLCSLTTSIGVLNDEVTAVISSVEACVNEKLAGHVQSTVSAISSVSTVSSVPIVSTLSTVSSNPIVSTVSTVSSNPIVSTVSTVASSIES